MQLGDVNPELTDRGRADRADDGLVLLGEGLEGAADPVVVEQVGGGAEYLLDSPRGGPVLDADQRGRLGDPVGDQCGDDLAVRQPGVAADRAEPVDRVEEVEAGEHVTDDGQHAELLVAVRGPVVEYRRGLHGSRTCQAEHSPHQWPRHHLIKRLRI